MTLKIHTTLRITARKEWFLIAMLILQLSSNFKSSQTLEDICLPLPRAILLLNSIPLVR